jgi:hypothetical protein
MLSVRRLCVGLVACTVCTGLAVVSARAALDERVLAGSRTLLDLPSEWLAGPPRIIAVNGARIEVSAGRSELALPALLDHVQAACRTSSGGLAARLATASQALAPGSGLRDGVLRAESAREGVVACLAIGATTLSLDEVITRLDHLARHLDLAELGGVLMVRAQARHHGSSFVVAASQGPVPLDVMFPAHADAAGFDPLDPPRPRLTRRLLSAHQVEREPALFVYESQRAPDELWADYLRELAARGWTLANPGAALGGVRQAALLLRAGRSAVVVVEPAGPGARLILLTSTESAQPRAAGER